jgi:hypothetical protein
MGEVLKQYNSSSAFLSRVPIRKSSTPSEEKKLNNRRGRATCSKCFQIKGYV